MSVQPLFDLKRIFLNKKTADINHAFCKTIRCIDLGDVCDAPILFKMNDIINITPCKTINTLPVVTYAKQIKNHSVNEVL